MSVSELSLVPFASTRGIFRILALDHRDALRNAFRRAGALEVTTETMLAVKSRIAAVLGRVATGILLDPDAIPDSRPTGTGLLVPLEEQGHETLEVGRLNHLLDHFGPAEALALGADGCKLLLYYRADHRATAFRQWELVERVSEQCHREGLPLVLEPLVYRLDGEDDNGYRQAFPDLVVAAAQDLAACGADLLKLQFPTGANEGATCALLTQAAWPLRWALLGGSEVDRSTFASQLEIACRAGASGFIAGRALWGGALGLSASDQEAWLLTEALPLFERLSGIAEDYGRSFR
jgi:tagatose-1,6-bisphosphate aldolase